MVEIRVPQMSLILLIGVSGAGKSHFGGQHFLPSQVISSDYCREVVSDSEDDQSATPDAFELLHHIVELRLRRGLLTVVDATNVQPEARQQLIALGKKCHVLVDAVVLDVDQSVAMERNTTPTGRNLPPHVIPRQSRELRRGMRRINKEGFRRVHVLKGADIDAAEFVYEPAWTDKTHLHGPFDIIGDVHGCRAELESLLTELGYAIERDDAGRAVDAAHPEGRTVVFVGDLVDRGPDTPGVLRLAMGMVASGRALCVAGNHEVKLVKALNGRKVRVAHGLAESLEQLETEDADFKTAAISFMDGLISHYRLDDGNLVVAHAGLKESYHGRASGRVRSFALYGDTTGETDEYGLPVRYPWAKEYRGKATVVYGHTPVLDAEWVNNTICLDTGVVFGGQLTALRYPEREIVAVDAQKQWYEPVRPLAPTTPTRESGALDYADVGGTRVIETGLHGRVKIREENAAAALEIASRFAVDPRWLVYLPPTMAPAETSTVDGMLEHPAEAFGYFTQIGAERVVCQEKHMGSRAVAVVCRDAAAAHRHFEVDDGSVGAIYTRTGRTFFNDAALTAGLLDRVRAAADAVGLWEKLDSDWVVLDAELLPWSAKAKQLIRDQYAATGAAARVSLAAADAVLRTAAGRGLEVSELLERNENRARNATAFADAYARYCWDVDGLSGVRLAPFQLLAAQGHNLARRPHDWHLDTIAALAAADATETLMATRHVYVDLADDASRAAAVEWWTALTAVGGEGMVVKPVESVLRTEAGLVQPGVKVRGREYLRIIYGPDYTEPANLDKLRNRFLGRKRSLALREYALGIEALDRLAAGNSLWRVHEPVFGVLALESEPVDPRL